MAQQRQIKNLDELMDGALTERFNAAMVKVMDNVFDPNTSPRAKRQIQIIIDIAPDERRDTAIFKVDVKHKIAPPMAISQTVFLHQDDYGHVTATEVTKEIPGQIDMQGEETALPKIVEFNRSKQQ